VGAVSRVFCGCLFFEALKFVLFRGLDPARDFELVRHCRLALMTSNYRHIDSVTLGRQIWCRRADGNNPTGESRLGAELDASELVKEVKIKLNILDRTNYRFDSKRKILPETAKTVAID
jgi:hypothetical protein